MQFIETNILLVECEFSKLFPYSKIYQLERKTGDKQVTITLSIDFTKPFINLHTLSTVHTAMNQAFQYSFYTSSSFTNKSQCLGSCQQPIKKVLRFLLTSLTMLAIIQFQNPGKSSCNIVKNNCSENFRKLPQEKVFDGANIKCRYRFLGFHLGSSETFRTITFKLPPEILLLHTWHYTQRWFIFYFNFYWIYISCFLFLVCCLEALHFVISVLLIGV